MVFYIIQVLRRKCLTPTVTPNVTLMSKLPVMDTLQGHPFDGHLPRKKKHVSFSIS